MENLIFLFSKSSQITGFFIGYFLHFSFIKNPFIIDLLIKNIIKTKEK